MSARPTFTDRPFDYLLTQRECRDSVRYASAVHQIRDRETDTWGRYGMGALLVILIVALVVIVATGKP